MADQLYPISPTPPAPRYPAGKRELTLAAALAVSSVFLWNAILYGGFSLGFALGSIAVILCSVWYLLGSGYRFDWYSGTLMGFSLLIAAGFGWSSSYLKFFMVQILLCSVNLSLCLLTGQNRRDPGGAASVLDAFRACFSISFGSLSPALRGLSDTRKRADSAGKKWGAAVLGLVIAVPVVAVMGFLLTQADAAFEGLMALLPETDWSEPVWSAVCGLFAAGTAYARALGLRHKEKAVPKERTFSGISPVTVNILLGAVAGLYGVYLLSQLAYLGGGFSGILPEGYTLAQYARRGFFEMAWLSAINLGLLCFSMGLVEKGEQAPRLSQLLCLFLGLISLFLVAAASGKMLLYIRSYGLTRLRVLTELFMVWLAVTTVLVCLWLFRPRLPYMKGAVITSLLLSTLTFWVDVDAQVARYNVRAYQSGTLQTIDVSHLGNLGCGAVPYLAELAQDEDPEVAEAAQRYLKIPSEAIQDLRDWNYSKAAAEKILNASGSDEQEGS